MSANASSGARLAIAYGVWPVVMAASLFAAWWGFAEGIGTPLWAFVVSSATFLVVLGLEHTMPAVPGWSLFRDRGASPTTGPIDGSTASSVCGGSTPCITTRLACNC